MLRHWKSQNPLKDLKSLIEWLGLHTFNMRHLFVVGEFVVVSHLKIFPLQLLEPADKPMAGPSSSKGKILR